MRVFKTFNLRIYPNEQQKRSIDKTLGIVRYLHNHFLNEMITKYNKTKKQMYYKEITEILAKLKTSDAIFINELMEATIDRTIKNLLSTFKRYMTGKNNIPKYKSKNQSRQSYFIKNVDESIKFEDNKIYIQGLGKVKFAKAAIPFGRLYNATIINESNHKYYISLVSHEYRKTLSPNQKNIGIDLGIKSLITLSNGEKYDIEQQTIKRMEIKIGLEHKKLSRKKEQAKKDNRSLDDSVNFQKQKAKIYNLHRKLNDLKKDNLHQISTMIIKKYQIICIEDLDVEELINQRRISKHIQRSSWGTFVKMLEYKADWYGREIIKVSRWYPSTTTCSNCKMQVKSLSLDIRTWNCPKCNATHDRDINASINILNEGLRIRML